MLSLAHSSWHLPELVISIQHQDIVAILPLEFQSLHYYHENLPNWLLATIHHRIATANMVAIDCIVHTMLVAMVL
ncbi:hypothetical protein DERF_004718 [Dermatophagoides farinae]|uniref:Uncharacterized protein n=1 Tax=Dermatophagoides farinae TaxID=6954 RepID=A0A922I6Q7_DERFA|nr:hypothetical protein DERF_004718 [Dermatophagoides farinae]